MDGYKAIVLEEAEKLYSILVDQLVCEVVNENVHKITTAYKTKYNDKKEQLDSKYCFDTYFEINSVLQDKLMCD